MILLPGIYRTFFFRFALFTTQMSMKKRFNSESSESSPSDTEMNSNWSFIAAKQFGGGGSHVMKRTIPDTRLQIEHC